MDIGSAFTFAFDDQDWIKKLAIGGALIFGATLLSPIIIGLALLFPVLGYMLLTLENVRDSQTPALPEWSDFGSLFSRGGMVFVIGLIYNIPALLLYCVSFGIQFALTNADSDVAASLGFVAVCLSCFQIILSLLAYFLIPAAIIRYSQFGTMGAAFQFGEIIALVRNNLGDYVVAVLLSWVAGFIAIFGLILCGIGIFFTNFWALLVSANLYGQLARKANL